jgi:four helix bundle protein
VEDARVPLPYRQLEVWQRAHQIAQDVMALAERPALRRRPELRSQLLRAAWSVPANIAEGRGRRTRRDFASFVGVARGSLFELDYWLLVCHECNAFEPGEYPDLSERVERLSAKLAALIESLRSE